MLFYLIDLYRGWGECGWAILEGDITKHGVCDSHALLRIEFYLRKGVGVWGRGVGGWRGWIADKLYGVTSN